MKDKVVCVLKYLLLYNYADFDTKLPSRYATMSKNCSDQPTNPPTNQRTGQYVLFNIIPNVHQPIFIKKGLNTVGEAKLIHTDQPTDQPTDRLTYGLGGLCP